MGYGQHGGAHRVEDARQLAPRGSDFERVDHEPLAGEPLQGARVVAVVHPALDPLGAELAGVGARLGHDAHGGVDDGGMAFVEHQ